ncbi:unnamed protein product [Arabis nemorensis]|uniref:Uncharacterized protein n=1 Tax=Arabis nemorensis TaxID=586526 RepID=A0A565C897_9BRAS|nr:unnamed protein product [Arabis nemorensis]
MGSKEGWVVEFLLRLTNVTRFHIMAKPKASTAAFFTGFAYGDYREGSIKDLMTQENVERLTRDYETRRELYPLNSWFWITSFIRLARV